MFETDEYGIIKVCQAYLRFLPKQPEFILAFAYRVFCFGARHRSQLFLAFRRVADGPVRTRPAQVLTEVLKRKVTRWFEAGFKRLHHDSRVLGGLKMETEGKVSTGLGLFLEG